MIERLMLHARRAATASIAIGAIFAVNVLRKSLSKCEFWDARLTHKKQGMWNFVDVDHSTQALYSFQIANYVGEFHIEVMKNI